MSFKDPVKQRVFQLAWYHKRHERAVRHLGGKCAQCGSSEGTLSVTSLTIGEKLGKVNFAHAWPKVLEQLKTKRLLCAPCLYKTCADYNATKQSAHGTWSRWRRGRCRCALCRAACTRAMKLKKEKHRETVRIILKKRIADKQACDDKTRS